MFGKTVIKVQNVDDRKCFHPILKCIILGFISEADYRATKVEKYEVLEYKSHNRYKKK